MTSFYPGQQIRDAHVLAGPGGGCRIWFASGLMELSIRRTTKPGATCSLIPLTAHFASKGRLGYRCSSPRKHQADERYPGSSDHRLEALHNYKNVSTLYYAVLRCVVGTWGLRCRVLVTQKAVRRRMRSRVLATQKAYIKSKPAKYGIKIWWTCNSVATYPLNGQVYLGLGEALGNILLQERLQNAYALQRGVKSAFADLGMLDVRENAAARRPAGRKRCFLYPREAYQKILRCCCGKLCESIAAKQIASYVYLLQSACQSEVQHAYRKLHSTETALLKMTDDWLDNMDNGFMTAVVLLDYSAAFDLVDHNLLLQKLETYGFTKVAWDWTENLTYDNHIAHKKCNGSLAQSRARASASALTMNLVARLCTPSNRDMRLWDRALGDTRGKREPLEVTAFDYHTLPSASKGQVSNGSCLQLADESSARRDGIVKADLEPAGIRPQKYPEMIVASLTTIAKDSGQASPAWVRHNVAWVPTKKKPWKKEVQRLGRKQRTEGGARAERARERNKRAAEQSGLAA
ncbi:hypothetical protein Bbelb_362340 [Branchiostoma belcheri]|nr:hypothetical protein Bbelb_362340 [Branchiostoma belcheri]